MQPTPPQGPLDDSPDSQDRIRDFLARHGGPGTCDSKTGTRESGLEGWSEVFAADGCRLVCEWSRLGTREELNFSELPPGAPDRHA
jgi:hypothetical protein